MKGLLERQAYLQSKPGKGLLTENLTITKDYFHLERHGDRRLQDGGKKLQRRPGETAECLSEEMGDQAHSKKGWLSFRKEVRHENLYCIAGFVI